jgi:hypothetical protein
MDPESSPMPDPPPGTSGACGESLEPNDTASSACDIPLDVVTVSGLADGDEIDAFAFGGLAGHTYTMDLVATGACSSFGISSSVTLERDGQSPLQLLAASSQGTTRVAREITPAADGRVVIVIEGGCGYELAVWRSIADGLQQDPASLEPNNSPSTATPLVLDTFVTSVVAAASDPRDFFALDVSAGDTYTLDLMATGACSSFGIDARVELLSAAGRSELLQTQSQGPTRVAREFRPGASGRAVIEVSGSCAYELAALRSADAGLIQDANTLEPNDSPSTGTPLALDESASSAVTSRLDPDDFFRIPVIAGRTYTLDLIGRSGCGSFDVSGGATLAAPTGTSTLLSTSSQGTTRTAREFTPNADGFAVVEVSGSCAYDVAVYQGTDDGLEHDAATLEPNNSASTGTRLALDELVVSQTQSGEDPDDFFIVPVEAAETYTLQVSGTGACSTFGLSASARLVSAAGTSALLSASSQGTNTTARTFTPSSAGQAVILLSGNCGYELQVLSP